ncbi:MAG TPA: protein kinase [Thermoanaerobaculia bacterium]|nr:protein kinase [Thermoanaerobaculia bacterium]
MLSAGDRLGPYEIVARIGAGGMGEVWQATDTRLDRSVAIKILPAELAQNPQLKARFEREAKTISQLNHPHICTLHDVGEETLEGGGTRADSSGSSTVSYLVMELIDGETLADRLARGPLSLPEVLRYGVEMAEALDKAHRAGIVHRDLKPGNIMLTRTGSKLLDFGLAKSAVLEISTDGLTQQKPLTQEGTILGTFQYMAPEQLEGIEADARSDIFAFGAVLYEMATGKRAFEGKTKTSLIAAIVDRDPVPISQLQPLTPPTLEHVISRCIEKDPEDRWQSARDIAEELKWIASAGSQVGVAAPLAVRRRTRERLAWSLNLVTALVVLAATTMFFMTRKPVEPTIVSSILPPAGMRIVLNGGAAISPDGRFIVAVLEDARSSRGLWMRPLHDAEYRLLPGTEDASYPFWSPDSRQIGFFATGRLKTVDAMGGPVQSVCDAAAGRGGTWSPDGTIVFTASVNGILMKVPATGGEPTPATEFQKGETSHRWPSFLPDGQHFVYLAMGDNPSIVRGSLDSTSDHHQVLRANSSALYSRTGHLLYSRESSVIAVPFNPGKGITTGDPIVVVAEGVAFTDRFTSVFSVSNDGALVYLRGAGFRLSQLVWVDRSGRDQGTIAPPGLFFSPRISHDQRRVAVDLSNVADGQGDIWIWDLQRGVSSRLTYDPANESVPLWSADEKQIIYHGVSSGTSNLYRVPSGGTGVAEELVQDDQEKRPTDISPDGRWLAFNSDGGSGSSTDIWIYSFDEKKATPWLKTPFTESAAQFSPDGKWIAYQSDESGRSEIYVRAFPDSEEKWLISSGGGSMPAWRGDGREIYYISADRTMMAVPVTLGDKRLDAGASVALFDASVRMHVIRQYDVVPDGSRFLLNRQADDGPGEPITLLQNWAKSK